ncbi:DUF1902 domain-containing protein [Neopusillimonas maritima]|nr:DUF1902 domain-containing protein [Neopusillimonas maritima]
MYPIGYPFWKLAARCGITIRIPVNVERDTQAQVYIATSPKLPGLVVEASSLDELRAEVIDVASMLIVTQSPRQIKY